jgi:hypothetical protein
MGDRKLEKDEEGGGRSRGGEGRYLWSSKKQQGPCTRAFPEPEAAIPKRANRRTEIILNILMLYTLTI